MKKHIFSVLFVLAAIFSAAFITSCNDDGVEIDVSVMRIDPSDAVVELGSAETLSVVILPENATNKEVAWESDNPAVATVDKNGKVTALTEGTTVVTAKLVRGGKTAKCTVTVVEKTINVTGVKLNKSEAVVYLDETEKLIATLLPANATNRTVVWSSSAPVIAAVSEEGEVSGLREGNAVITVTTADGEKTAECAVKVEKRVIAVTGIELNVTEKQLLNGEYFALAATVYPENAALQGVVWSVDNEDVIEIIRVSGTPQSVIYSKKPGKATVTVTTQDGGYTASCVVTVTPIVVHTCGTAKYSDTEYYAYYWRDGVPTKLSASVSEASGISVSGDNVYISGTSNGKAAYWRNGSETTLHNSESRALGICVAGDDVHIVGYVELGGKRMPAYWKNGGQAVLVYSEGYMTGVDVSGNDVYMSGIILNDPNPDNAEEIAVYWKNLSRKTLTRTRSRANDIMVMDGNEYITGALVLPERSLALTWFGSILSANTTYATNSDSSEAESLFSGDGIFYAVGYKESNGKKYGQLWYQHGERYDTSSLADIGMYHAGCSIGRDIYLAGYLYKPSGHEAWVWKGNNEPLYNLQTGFSADVEIHPYGIAVVP